LGSGKGSIACRARRVKPGVVMFNIDDVTHEIARKPLRFGAMTRPIATGREEPISVGFNFGWA
jgi:large subunit ribosomal protein L16